MGPGALSSQSEGRMPDSNSRCPGPSRPHSLASVDTCSLGLMHVDQNAPR